MLKRLDSLGEHTINRITEVALSSQMKQVDQLSVNVTIDPQHLAKGIVNSLVMEGTGLVTPSNLRAERISLQIEDIGVYPFKALMGNIQLTKPATGKALITLRDTDIAETLKVFCITENTEKLSFKEISCKFELPQVNHESASSEIVLQSTIYNSEKDALTPLDLAVTIAYNSQAKAIVYNSVNYPCGEEFQYNLGTRLQAQLLNILNFQFPLFDGITFVVEGFDISDNEIELMAIAEITSFPKTVAISE